MSKFNFNQEIYIFGQKGARKILNSIIKMPYTAPFAELPYSVKIYELPKEEDRLAFHVESKNLLHSSLCSGFRFELEKKVIAYCPDTGYCENAVRLAKNADLLISECSYKSGQSHDEWPHLNPETLSRLQKRQKLKDWH